MHIIKLFFVVILPAMAIGGIATSAAEYVKNYNLVDLIKDKINALLGRVVLDAQYVIKVAKEDAQHVEQAILNMPNRVLASVRKRV